MAEKKLFTEVNGHYNVLFKNPPQVIKADVIELTHRASVFDLNEGTDHKTIEAALVSRGFEWLRNGASDWLCWDRLVWGRGPWHHIWKLSPGAHAMGYKFDRNPARYLLGQSLVHLASDTLHDFYGTHLTAGYAKEKGSFPDKLEQFKDLSAKMEVHRIDRITEACIRRRGHVDFDHLQGDINSRQGAKSASWYPANVWRDTWVPDNNPNAIDWMMHSRRAAKNHLRVVKRWNEGNEAGWSSDHPASFKKIQFPVTN